jgi:hypothetical protein
VTVTLSEAEIYEAVREWCTRRGIPVPEKHSMDWKYNTNGSGYTTIGNARLVISVYGLQIAPKDGPYR